MDQIPVTGQSAEVQRAGILLPAGIINILCWDRNGFCFRHKRLGKQRFTSSDSEAEVMEYGARELNLLSEGLDLL
ncbi:transposase [Pseudodesulfovibrio profundus]|uniref:transposase n=1 Tax=Pseudodesulfovibrio profundus TaxID=57320 RepID=UPI001E4F3BF1|nr:transposase [Pseudodesulfovibrio profundus]